MNLRTFLISLLLAVLIAGCATTGPTAPQPLSPAQVAAVVCPQLNLAHSQLVVFNAALSADPATAAAGAKATAQLATVQPLVDAVCAAGATVTATNVQALVTQALPALGTLVGSLPLPAAEEAQVQGALVLAETAAGLAGVVEAQIKAAQTDAAAPASASNAAKP